LVRKHPPTWPNSYSAKSASGCGGIKNRFRLLESLPETIAASLRVLMGYKYLGNMGVQVSRLHFGTMSFDDTGMREEIAALPPTPPPATQRSETQTSAK
jgi:hypothetical protein